MDPRRFLDLARVYKGGHATAESYRSAISREYYAAFNVGVETLNTIGIQLTDGPGAHGELQQCLGVCEDPDLDDARDLLGNLSGRRRRADYRMDAAETETRKEADIACREAAEAIRILEMLINDPSKNAAIIAMKDYARDTRHLRVT